MKLFYKLGVISVLLSFCLLALSGCNTAKTDSSDSTPPNKTDSKPADNPNTTTSNSGDKIGVAECDEYLDKYEACVSSKVPEAARGQLKASMETTRKSWKEIAATPEGKSGLAMTCKTALDTAKQSMASYGYGVVTRLVN